MFTINSICNRQVLAICMWFVECNRYVTFARYSGRIVHHGLTTTTYQISYELMITLRNWKQINFIYKLNMCNRIHITDRGDVFGPLSKLKMQMYLPQSRAFWRSHQQSERAPRTVRGSRAVCNGCYAMAARDCHWIHRHDTGCYHYIQPRIPPSSAPTIRQLHETSCPQRLCIHSGRTMERTSCCPGAFLLQKINKCYC